MKKDELTQKLLMEKVTYCSETGKFFRNSTGDEITYTSKGYIRFWVNNYQYMGHRLAWLYAYGEWPLGQIDHINGVKRDNRLGNLRDVSQSENQKNASKRKDNLSGVTGVHYDNSSDKWKSQITEKGKRFHLGLFDCKLMATIIRKRAEIEYGYHENHGR